MNIKATTKYHISEHKKAIFIFYIVMICIILLALLFSLSNPEGETEFNGIELSAGIFLFVAGLNAFKEPFSMFLQNGISRKTLFYSTLLSTFILCAGMALINKVIFYLTIIVSSLDKTFYIHEILGVMYPNHTATISPLLVHIESFIFNICLYFMFFIIGFFITISYYRMNKGLKTGVSVGIPVVLFIIFPTLDALFLNNGMTRSFLKAMDFLLGLSAGNPWFSILTFIVSILIFSQLSWLLMRKAVIRD